SSHKCGQQRNQWGIYQRSDQIIKAVAGIVEICHLARRIVKGSVDHEQAIAQCGEQATSVAIGETRNQYSRKTIAVEKRTDSKRSALIDSAIIGNQSTDNHIQTIDCNIEIFVAGMQEWIGKLRILCAGCLVPCIFLLSVRPSSTTGGRST